MRVETDLIVTGEPVLAVGQEFEVAIRLLSPDGTFYANAFDATVQHGLNLTFLGFRGGPGFSDCRAYHLLERQANGTYVWDRNPADGDFGVTFWADATGDNPTKYPRVDAAGLHIGTLLFRAVSPGSTSIQLLADTRLHYSFWSKAYDASVPNLKRWLDRLGVATVGVT